MIKQHQLGYTGMRQSIAKSKPDNSKYFSARNIRIVATDRQTTMAVTNEHGNELRISIPTPTLDLTNTRFSYTNVDQGGPGGFKFLEYTRVTPTVPGCEIESNYAPAGIALTSGQQKIIGTIDTRDGAIIATTDDNGWDCIWELSGIASDNSVLTLKYLNNLGFKTENLLQLLYNYENSIIEKIYMVDGNNQLRFMNLRQSLANGDLRDLADTPASSVNTVSNLDISQPEISSVTGGGSHTAGMVQYAYNLYVLNGSQTTISPLSALTPLDKGEGLGGGEVNETVGRTVVVDINRLDEDYTHIKLYAIKYTSYNQSPEISLIADREIDNYSSFSYYDDGTVISSVSLAEFTFLGSDPIIPQHIESKDSRLFAFNLKEKKFEVGIDARIYGHNTGGACQIWENIQLVNNTLVGDVLNVSTATYSVPLKHDSVNRNYSVYNRVASGVQYGAEGKYFRLSIDQSTVPEDKAITLQLLKDREIYRFSIEFFNDLGQTSSPQWLCDLRAPDGNLEGNYNKVKFEIKPDFTTWLNSTAFADNQKPVGYRLLRADRTLSDRTIITQGFINPMVANYKHDKKDNASLHYFKNAASKMPSMVRLFENSFPFMKCQDGNDTANNSSGVNGRSNDRETLKSCSSKDWRAQTWQFNRLMQLFSPEVLFSNVEVDSSHELKIIGMARQSRVAAWSAEVNPVSKEYIIEAKFENGINTSSPGVQTEAILGNPNSISDITFFGPDNGEHGITFHQVFREFNGAFVRSTNSNTFQIYGSPEITQTGADFKAYNGDFKLRYSNHLLSLLQDDWRKCSGVRDDAEQQVYGANSYGAKCITFAEGSDDSSTPLANRRTISQIKASTGISQNDGVLVAEFVKNDNALYLGNIYGGNSYEAKSSSSYIEIGSYQDISVTSFVIESPGDTFVQNFNFEKLSKTDTDLGDRKLNQVTEIISIKVESTIDLKNRNDLSIYNYDNRWQPRFDEYQKYNRVYSQQPTLVQITDPGFKFKKVNEYDTRVIASKEKIPGENIDSWTDFLVNETQDLDGKYGPINGTINFKDEIYTLQDRAVAHISINPRVQTSGSDGIDVQLGTGKVLHDYQYLSTVSGCLNKRGIVASGSAFYYFDLINKSLVRFSGKVDGLSDAEGFHEFFINNIKHDNILVDNPLKGMGISTGYNAVNNDVYFTFHQSQFNTMNNGLTTSYTPNDYTICFNEAVGSFTSFYDYKPAWYINKGDKMFTSGPDSFTLWEHFKGVHNNFYGTQYDSEIVFNAAPKQGDGEYTFNNIGYKMEMKDTSGKDMLNTTFSSVQVWNEYQDTGERKLELRKNLRRKNRSWNLTLPRSKGSKDRIKSPWAFIRLKFDNDTGARMAAHDLTLSYTEY